jgi:hypothetical protein
MAKNFTFSKRSLDNLAGVNSSLVKVTHRALEISRIDFVIISGLRSDDEQMKLYTAGKSLSNGISRANGGTGISKHQLGLAVDFAPLDPKTGKSNFNRQLCADVATAFYEASAQLNLPICWGGTWQGFEDCPHIQMR